MSKLFSENWISLKYLIRYPNSPRTKEWLSKIVAIDTDGNYWKANGCGYTYRPNAGAYTLQEAIGWTEHLIKSRSVIFHSHGIITNENHEFDPSGRRKSV